MKNIFQLLVSILLLVPGVAPAQQWGIQYTRCSTCTAANVEDDPNITLFEYDNPQNYLGTHTSSDYGPRPYNNYDWHNGIDISSESGDDDMGDKILALSAGGIAQIDGNGSYKVIQINSFGADYAYGHIFRTSTETGDNLGSMVLFQSGVFWYIFFVDEDKVLGQVGAPNTVVYDGTTYTVQKNVAFNESVGPIGDSGDNSFPAHVHLYSIPDGNTNWNSSSHTILLNPLASPILYPSSDHNLQMLHSNNANLMGVLLKYDNTPTSIRVRDSYTPGVGYVPNTNSVKFFIKPKNSTAEFRKIKGGSYMGEIIYGGRPDEYAKFPASILIDHNWGNETTTGVHPYWQNASGGSLYDDFYFSDFYTRIHKSNDRVGAISLAGRNKDAEYPDGEYTVQSVVYIASPWDNWGVTNTTQDINLDNFWPYVEGVDVFFNGNSVYSANYYNPACQPSALECDRLKFAESSTSYPSLPILGPPSSGTVKMKVLVSEPLLGNISGQLWEPNGTAHNIDNLQSLDGNQGLLWEVTYDNVAFASTGEYKFEFYGEDKAGNDMLNFDTWGNSGEPEKVPHRTSASAWSPSNPQASAGKSREYKFKFKAACGVPFSGETSENSFTSLSPICDCDPLAEFTFIPGADGLTVQFNATASTGTEPLSYSWVFGDGTSGSGITPTHIFSEGGQYLVTLKVTDDCGNTSTAEHAVTVQEGSPASMWVTLTGATLAAECQQVAFSANVVGGVPPYKYTWHMGDEYCAPACPTDCTGDPDYEGNALEIATFTSTGFFTNPVCVEVEDAIGTTETQCLQIKVKQGIQPLEIIVNGTPACGSSYLKNSQIVFIPDIDPLSAFEYPTDYYWDFGDGESYLDNIDGGGVAIHEYAANGNYTVTLTVSDPNGSMQALKPISICTPGGNGGSNCDLINSSNPDLPTVVLDYGGNSETHFDFISNQDPLCQPIYRWTGRMDDCGLGYLFYQATELAGLPIGGGLYTDLNADNWWGIVTEYRQPWGCLSLQCTESGSFCETCTGPQPSNPCIAYIVPSELLVSEIEATGSCQNYQLTALVEGGGWKKVGSEYTYKEYLWKAYDIDNSEQEIDILSNADTKIPTINTQHVYFDKFTNGQYPQFIVKLRVTDFANQVKEASDIISFNPFRLTVKNDYKRCPDTWSYFESQPLATGGTGNYQFTWTTPGGSLDFESNDPHDQNPYFKAPANGSKQYNLLVEMLNASGGVECQLSKQINVTATPLVVDIPAFNWPICSTGGREIGLFDLSNIGGSGNYSFEWTTAQPSDLDYLSDIFSQNPVLSGVPVGQAITYTLIVSDLMSQCSDSHDFTITSVANDHTVTIKDPVDICYGEEVVLNAQGAPVNNTPPFGDIFHFYQWTTTNPHHDLSGLGNYVANLPLDEIISSHPGNYVYSVRYLDFVSGCYADASVNFTIPQPWKHNGYVPTIESIIAGTPAQLWEPTVSNTITYGIQNLNNIDIDWIPFDPPIVDNNANTMLPKRGMFTPTTAAPYLTMTVTDNATGCSESYKTMRYIISEAMPELWVTASNTATCIGGEVCFDIVFDAHLANYNTSLLPNSILVGGAINAPINSPQQPSFKYFSVKLELVNSAGLYKGTFCETAFFQHETGHGPHYRVSFSSITPSIWDGVESAIVDVAIDESATPVGNEEKCLPVAIENGHERALSFKFGLECTSIGKVHNRKSFSMARDFIEIYPNGQIELVPSLSAGPSLGKGARLSIDPCIHLQLESPDPDESQTPPIIVNRAEEIEPTPIGTETTLNVFPNPFTGEVNIQYTLPPDCKEEAFINLLDITGKHLRTIEKRKSLLGGQFEIIFDGKYLPPGVYFYELAAGNCRKIKKAIKIGF
ncbi:MAG: PKD domain-containing protein [Saprospiraceae bacterium]